MAGGTVALSRGHSGHCTTTTYVQEGGQWTQYSWGPHTLRPPLVTWEEPSEKSISLADVK